MSGDTPGPMSDTDLHAVAVAINAQAVMFGSAAARYARSPLEETRRLIREQGQIDKLSDPVDKLVVNVVRLIESCNKNARIDVDAVDQGLRDLMGALRAIDPELGSDNARWFDHLHDLYRS